MKEIQKRAIVQKWIRDNFDWVTQEIGREFFLKGDDKNIKRKTEIAAEVLDSLHCYVLGGYDRCLLYQRNKKKILEFLCRRPRKGKK